MAGARESSGENGPLALALGGGGARGIAHIGVFKVIHEERVAVDMIVGASIGALGAALFGLDPDWRSVRERVFAGLRRKAFAKYGMGLTDSATGRGRPGAWTRAKLFLKKSAALQLLLARRSLVSRRRLREAVEAICPDRTFAETKIPVAIVALDLKTGREVVIREGSLREAVVASASLAGFFPPVAREGHLLVDPSPVSSVPVDMARELGAAAVIAVDIRSRVMPQEEIASGADAVFRAAALASERANDSQIARSDVVISPGVGSTYWSDFRDLDAHLAEGERAARAAMPEIRELLERFGQT